MKYRVTYKKNSQGEQEKITLKSDSTKEIDLKHNNTIGFLFRSMKVEDDSVIEVSVNKSSKPEYEWKWRFFTSVFETDNAQLINTLNDYVFVTINANSEHSLYKSKEEELKKSKFWRPGDRIQPISGESVIISRIGSSGYDFLKDGRVVDCDGNALNIFQIMEISEIVLQYKNSFPDEWKKFCNDMNETMDRWIKVKKP